MRTNKHMTTLLHKKKFFRKYHDHASEQDINVSSVQGGSARSSKKEQPKKQFLTSKNTLRKGPRGGVEVPFPEKLHKMLSRAKEDGHDHIVSWQPHGRCFLVHKPDEFVTQVLPAFFKQSKITSFQRQLNLYGFSRITTGLDRGAYYHELFLRGKEFLCKRMLRTAVKGTGIKAMGSPIFEPNFYLMPPLPDADQVEIVNNNNKKKKSSKMVALTDGAPRNANNTRSREHDHGATLGIKHGVTMRTGALLVPSPITVPVPMSISRSPNGVAEIPCNTPPIQVTRPPTTKNIPDGSGYPKKSAPPPTDHQEDASLEDQLFDKLDREEMDDLSSVSSDQIVDHIFESVGLDHAGEGSLEESSS